MKKIDIPAVGLVSIFIGVISLWIFLVNGSRYVLYLYPLDLAYLSETNIKTDQYVKGTISECVTVPVFDRQDLMSGSSGEMIGMGRTYICYTVPISRDRYIRIWIYDKETLEGMESIVDGRQIEVAFTGQVKKGGLSLNAEWYNWNPEFDQSKIVSDYSVWQTTAETEKNLCIGGFLGMMIAALIYFSYGRIRIMNVSPEMPKRGGSVYNYNKENELAIARRRLEMYEEQKKIYRKKSMIGMICIVMGILIILVAELLKLKAAGLIFIIYGGRKCWDFFINSSNRYAIEIARLFLIETLQNKRAEEECKIEELERRRDECQ